MYTFVSGNTDFHLVAKHFKEALLQAGLSKGLARIQIYNCRLDRIKTYPRLPSRPISLTL